MSEQLTINLQGQQVTLLHDKALYWESHRLLLVSDLHLGKAGHFRKNGIPVSAQIHYGDLDRLSQILRQFKCDQVVFLGDLFNSDYNSEWSDFVSWTQIYPDVQFTLVKGNHDILNPVIYRDCKMEVVDELRIKPFLLTHIEQRDEDWYNISGHVHPCVRMRGPGKQGVRLPVFYFSKDAGLMPAFGNFTGSHAIRPKLTDRVYGIIGNSVKNLDQYKPVPQ